MAEHLLVLEVLQRERPLAGVHLLGLLVLAAALGGHLLSLLFRLVF